MARIFVNAIIQRALKIIRAESVFQNENTEARINSVEMLNDILSELNATGLAIPYKTTVSFNLTGGKGSYTVGDIPGADVATSPFSSVDYVNLIIDQIRYAVVIVDDFAFLNQTMSLNIRGRPQVCRMIKADEVFTIEFLPVPDITYQCAIYGKKDIGLIDWQGEIELPDYCRKYLVYALAKSINNEVALNAWTPELESEYIKSQQLINAASAKDLRVRSAPPFMHHRRYFTYRLGVVK